MSNYFIKINIILTCLIFFIFGITFVGCSSNSSQKQNEVLMEVDMIYAHTESDVLEIKLENNSSAQAFLDLLKKGDIVVNMRDYGGFEKVGDLGATLPQNNKQITTSFGDVILYMGNQITIYYDTNTYTFTKLGKVQNKTQEELMSILKAQSEDISVRFSLTYQGNK